MDFEIPTNLRSALKLGKEVEKGNHEYKYKLTNMTDIQINHRISQMQWRLNEGRNIAYYHIGVEDSGKNLGISAEEMGESIENLRFIAKQTNSELTVKEIFQGEIGLTAEIIIKRKDLNNFDFADIPIVVLGDSNSGKSTLIASLVSSTLDNGHGLARTKVLTHNHEIETGNTSCISYNTIFYDEQAHILNNPKNVKPQKDLNTKSSLSLKDKLQKTKYTITLLDMAGHKKYFRTTIHGITTIKPRFAIICISLDQGITTVTRDHFEVCQALNIPTIFVITKSDLTKALQTNVINEITDILNAPTINLIDTNNCENINIQDILSHSSVLSISCVTGKGLNILQNIFRIFLLQDSQKKCHNKDLDLQIIGSFNSLENDLEEDDLNYAEEDFSDSNPDSNDQSKDHSVIIHSLYSSFVLKFNSDDHFKQVVEYSIGFCNEINILETLNNFFDGLVELGLFIEGSNFDINELSFTRILLSRVNQMVKLYDTFALGPTQNGLWIPVIITGLRVHNIPVTCVSNDQFATLKLSLLTTDVLLTIPPENQKIVLEIFNSQVSFPKLDEENLMIRSFYSSMKPRLDINGLKMRSLKNQMKSDDALNKFISKIIWKTNEKTPCLKVNSQWSFHVENIQQSIKIVDIITQPNSQESFYLCEWLFHPEAITMGSIGFLRNNRLIAILQIVETLS